MSSAAEVATLGVSRISFGPAPYLKAQSDLAAQVNSIK